MAEQCGYDKESVVFWHKYGLNSYMVRLVGSNMEAAKVVTCIPKDRVVEIYFEHLNFYHDDNQCGNEMKKNSLLANDTEEHSDEFDDENFNDSDYSLEEDDLLFFKNVDPSVESFGINITVKKKKNDGNQNYVSEEMHRKMQNEEGDSDCVDFDDTKSLNSDCDSEFEDCNFPKHNPKIGAFNPELELGMVLDNKKEFKEAVVANQAKIGKSIRWTKDDRERARAKCRTNACKWRILGSLMQRDISTFQIKTFVSEHTCFGWNYNNKTINSSWIARKYVDRVKSNKNWRTSEFRDTLSRELKFHVSMHQARRAKEKAIAMIDGDINDQFACKAGFKADCRKIIGVNGYKQKGLIEAFDLVLPGVSHRFCVRHLHNNFKRAGYSGMALKNALWKAASATTIDRFDACMTDLFELDKDAYAWLSAKVPSEWSRSHFSPLPKCDILLNNQCEVFNKFILDARDKPIVKLLETIRHLLMTRINSIREKAEKWNLNDICPTIKKKLAKTMKKAANYIPQRSNMWNYEVIGPVEGDNWAVDLYNRTCSCRQWELSGVPCKHAISSIWLKNDEVLNYVDDCYKVDTYRKIYEASILPMNGLDLWPKSLNPPPFPPSYLNNKKKGKKMMSQGLAG
uniref:Mutator transposable element, putative n=1 Tax=Solanum demissum TaxID=50514 RepID=Q6L470_SOLDE|nr:Mutator transposable element, putative [Solanum demissum]